MAFKKAAPQQAFVKMTLYGPPGSGKTMTALLFAEGLAKHRGKRVAYIDTEHGTDFYAKAIKARTVHPAEFDFDAIYTRSLQVALDEIKGLDTNAHGVVVIDSITHFWEAAIEAYSGKKTSIESIPMHAWGAIKRPYKQLMSLLIGMPIDVIICGRQKSLFDTNDDGELQKVGVGLKAEGETQYEPHICARMYTIADPEGGEKVAHCAMFVEKDRSSVLHGRKHVDPNFLTIRPVLDVLTDKTQAPPEDEADRIAKDSEINKNEAQGKLDKSLELYESIRGKISAADSIEKLGVASAEVKKNKKHLTEEHLAALAEVFNHNRDRLAKASAGAI